MPQFQLHQQLTADTVHIRNLPASALLLMNDSRFPWLVLVPRTPGLVELTDLSDADRPQVWHEIDAVARILKAEVQADKLNIAALGNVVPQLHIHIIARHHNDAAWPRPVWGVGAAEPYALNRVDALLATLNKAAEAAGL